MSYPANLSAEEMERIHLAMKRIIPKGSLVNVGGTMLTTLEDSTAHGCPKCSDGQFHTLYEHLSNKY
jgi:hypothetical protein